MSANKSSDSSANNPANHPAGSVDNSVIDSYPLSPVQQGMLIDSLYDPRSGVYIIQHVHDLHGVIVLEYFWKAWQCLFERHAILRTSFHWSGLAEPIQMVHRQVALPKEERDLLHLSPVQQQEIIEAYLAQNLQQGFDFTSAPLARLALFRLGEFDYCYVRAMHHLITDGRTSAILYEEFAQIYQSFCHDQALSLEPPRSYRLSVDWLRQQDVSPAEAYWRAQLRGYRTCLHLWVDRLALSENASLAHDQPVELGRQSMRLSKYLTASLEVFAQEQGVNLSTLIHGAWVILLSRYSGERDIVFGTTRACRRSTLEGANDIVGPLINTPPMRVDASGDQDLLPWLRSLREKWTNLRPFENTPLFKIREWSQFSPGMPLFESMVNFDRRSFESILRSIDLPWQTRGLRNIQYSGFPLTLGAYAEPEFLFTLDHDCSRFDAATVQRMLGHLQTLLQAMVANPNCKLVSLPLLTAVEQEQILSWSGAGVDHPDQKTLPQVFEEVVKRSPEVAAVLFGREKLDYRELNARANQLAHYLQKQGVGPGVLVGICLERSFEMIIGLLGILKAGGAYLSLDPANPPERLAFIAEDTRIRFLLAHSNLREKFTELECSLVYLDAGWPEISLESTENPQIYLHPDDLAYVMYTSGSTGMPKGTYIPHRAVVRLVCGSNYASFDAGEVFLQFAPLAFDASTFEIWGSLLNGACLVLFPGVQPSPAELVDVNRQYGVTTLWLTAGLFHAVVDWSPDAFRGLHQLLAGGDVLSLAHVRRLLPHLGECRLINGYGPTENTTFTCCYPVDPEAALGSSVPIGRPIAQTQVYILDSGLNPVPEGVAGELYIGGEGLAWGYLNRPGLTAERFIPNPFAEGRAGSRLYRAGDQARWLGDGNIEFLGRLDGQVKLRGYRIELGEIETALASHAGVKQAVVLLKEDRARGDKTLVGYVAADSKLQPTAQELRSYLKAKLPEYMLPSGFVFLESLPLNPNGKVDRQAMPALAIEEPEAGQGFEAPHDELERQLCQIWEEVLGVEPVSVKDNFFDLGGHSLLAMRLFTQIEQKMNVRLPLAVLFESPTVEKLAAVLHKDPGLVNWEILVPIRSQGTQPPFFCVHNFGGEVLDFQPLSKYLGVDQPFYGLQARGLDGKELPHTSIPEMAEYYLQAIRTRQPHGPYNLGGFCYGGVVAFEMACQLVAQGEQVALLVVIDGAAPSQGRRGGGREAFKRASRFVRNLPRWWETLLLSSSQEIDVAVRRRIRFIIRWVQRRLGLGGKITPMDMIGDQVSHLPVHLQDLMVVHLQSLYDYTPPPYPGRMTLIRTHRVPLLKIEDQDKGWGSLALGGVELKYIPGKHLDIFFEESQVQALAKELHESLEHAWSGTLPEGNFSP